MALSAQVLSMDPYCEWTRHVYGSSSAFLEEAHCALLTMLLSLNKAVLADKTTTLHHSHSCGSAPHCFDLC